MTPTVLLPALLFLLYMIDIVIMCIIVITIATIITILIITKSPITEEKRKRPSGLIDGWETPSSSLAPHLIGNMCWEYGYPKGSEPFPPNHWIVD